MTPTLSLITGTRNRPASFRRLLDSIMKHTDVSFEVVVSDASDSPIDETGFPGRFVAPGTETGFANVRIIPERPRLGCSAGFNVAFRAALGEWVLFLNDDATVERGYASAAIRFMEAHPEIGLGAIYYVDSTETYKGYHVNACSFGMVYANFGILRRTLGEQVGWLDTDLKMYGSDNSLTYRILMAGYGVAGIPDARAYHHSTMDEERIANNDYEFRIAQADLLKAKYGPHLRQMREVYERTGGSYIQPHQWA